MDEEARALGFVGFSDDGAVARLQHWIAIRRFRWAYFMHWMRPVLAETNGEDYRLIWLRHEAKAPKPEQFGLSPDTAPIHAGWDLGRKTGRGSGDAAHPAAPPAAR